MFQCPDVAGRTVRSLKLYENGPYGPEVSIEFEDGTTFTATLHTRHLLEGKLTQERDDEVEVIQQCFTPAAP